MDHHREAARFDVGRVESMKLATVLSPHRSYVVSAERITVEKELERLQETLTMDPVQSVLWVY